MESKDLEQHVGQRFGKAVSRHGHAFQAQVHRRVLGLFKSGSIAWEPELPEFPVVAGKKNTHVDLVLRRWVGSAHQMLVVECKQVNPSHSDWCFARSSDHLRSWGGAHVWGEHLSMFDEIPLYAEGAQVQFRQEQGSFATVGYEIKSGQKGVGAPTDKSGTGAIGHAATQACLGVNGLVNYYGQRRHQNKKHASVFLLPMVVTTAKLWFADRELADLGHSHAEGEPCDLREVDWVYYQYNQSPLILHAYDPRNNCDSTNSRDVEPGDAIDVRHAACNEFLRSVVIVRYECLEKLLSVS